MTVDDITNLPPADAEQRHLVDEIQHADDYDHFQHGDFPQCCSEYVPCGEIPYVKPTTTPGSIDAYEEAR